MQKNMAAFIAKSHAKDNTKTVLSLSNQSHSFWNVFWRLIDIEFWRFPLGKTYFVASTIDQVPFYTWISQIAKSWIEKFLQVIKHQRKDILAVFQSIFFI